MREAVFKDTLQIGFVVRDLDASIRNYVEHYGIGPWRIVECGPENAEDMITNDEPTTFAMRLAFAEVGRVEWELIQPLDERSHYAQFLATRGEGVHHIQVGVTDYANTVADLRRRGHSVLVGGTFSGTEIVSLSTDRDLGVIIEIMNQSSAV